MITHLLIRNGAGVLVVYEDLTDRTFKTSSP